MVNRGGVGAVLARGRAAVLLLSLALCGFWLLRHDLHDSSGSRRPDARPANSSPISASLDRLPFVFEPNRGQAAPEVDFQGRGNGYGLFLTSKEAILNFQGPKNSGTSSVRMQFVGANTQSAPHATEPLPGRTSYFIGNDPDRWHRNIPQFGRVRYSDLYPGIDLDFYGKQGRLEYDFLVKPDADPGRISLEFAGAESLRVADNGDLAIMSAGRELRFQTPHVYQTSSAGTQNVDGKFVLRGNRVGFELGAYDHRRAVVIDPVLTFSTYLGGAGNESCAAIAGTFVAQCPAIAVDSAGSIYIAGATTNTGSGWPGTPNLGLKGTGTDVFVARISNPGASPTLDYITFIGGSGTEYPTGVAVDSGFNVYVAGTTNSQDYPTVNGFEATPPNVTVQNHAFLSKLDVSGTVNLYSTYVAGDAIDTSSGLAVDSQGRAYVLGITTSPHFPTTAGALQATPKAANQFFLSKIDPTVGGPTSLLYSTYIGGSNPANGVVLGGAIAVDSSFNVYIAGGTSFQDMPVANAYQATSQGGTDIWAARLAPPATNTQQYTPVYETYLGAPNDASQLDVAYGIASDATNTYITGSTTSNLFTIPSTATAFQSSNGGGTDAFVAKLGSVSTTGTTQGTVPLNYFSYLGGSGQDVGLAIIADSNQNARVVGFTNSGTFPGTPTIFGSPSGTSAFFARLVTTGTSTTNTSATSVLGGSGTDIATSTALDPFLNSYIAGETSSGGFPVANPIQGSSPGGSDAFVTELGPNISGLVFACTNCTPNTSPVSPTVVGVGSNVTFNYDIYNLGDPVSGVIFTDTISGNSTITSPPSNCTSNTGGLVCNLGTVNTSAITTSGSTTTIASAAKISITVTPTAPTTQGPVFSIGNSGKLTIAGTNFQLTSPSLQAQVNDFGVQVTPALQTVTAGNQASYTVTVSPSAPIGFPDTVSLACGTGLPTGAQCVISSNPIPNLNNGAVTRILDIKTTARVTTPASLFHTGAPVYAFWLPVSGLALMGGISRRRRWLLAGVLGAVLGAITLLPACSKSSNSSITSGTPAGTYTVTINATSGNTTATRTTAVQLVVK